MKEKVFYVVTKTETERQALALALPEFCICKSRIDGRGFLFVPRKRSSNLFV